MFDFFSKVLRLCGNGKQNNWSVRVADYFFVDCACCIFWRGVVVGGFVSASVMIGIGIIILIWR